MPKPVKTILILIPCLLLLTAFLALPASADAKQKNTFDSVDTNDDDKIDLNEWLQVWADKDAGKKKFHQLDKNKDGVLTDEDGRIIFDARDKDENNRVSKGEYVFDSNDARKAEDEFVEYDSNRDGGIGWQEWRGNWPFMYGRPY